MKSFDLLRKKIKQTYIVTLSLTIALLTFWFVWTQYYFYSLEGQPYIINIAGKQRMLSQRIALVGNALVSEPAKAKGEPLKSELVALTREFLHNHEILVGRVPVNEEFNALNGELEALYFSPPAMLDRQVSQYAEQALHLASLSLPLAMDAQPIGPESSKQILDNLDLAVSLFEKQLSENLRENHWWHLISWVLTLLSVIFAVRLLFTPLSRLIEAQFDEVKRAQLDARLEKEQINKLVATKEEFLASMSHEFRSPISAIIGVLELLPNMQEKREQLIQRAEQSCFRLLMLTNNLVDSMQNRQLDEEKDKEEFDLVRLLDDALSHFFYQCQEKGLNYEVFNETSLPHLVVGSPSPLSKAFKNLLDNAVKFTHHGIISVYNRVAVNDGQLILQIRVVDTGIGIDDASKESIFDRFYKAHNKPKLYSGAGVGLYAARHQVREMGGDITVVSALNSGSEFCLSVPLQMPSEKEKHPVATAKGKFAVVDDQEITRLHLSYMIEQEGFAVDTYKSGAELLSNRDVIKDYDGIITDYFMPGINGTELANYLQAMLGKHTPPLILVSAAPQIANIVSNSEINAWQVFVKPIDRNRFIDALKYLSKPGYTLSPLPSSASILIVEDEPINAEILLDMIENLGYRGDVAEDGERALSKAGNNHYDVILLDLNLPDISGFEVATILNEQGTQAQMVAVTASTYETDRARSLATGMRYHLVKPVAYQELKNTLKLLLCKPVN